MSGDNDWRGVRSTFPLIAPGGDNDQRVTINSFKELFTFLGREDIIEVDPVENHPDLDSHRNARATTDGTTTTMHTGVPSYAFSAVTDPPVPQPRPAHNTFDVQRRSLSSQASNDASDSESGEDNQDEDVAMHPRDIVLPGCPPSGRLMSHEEHVVQRIRNFHLPEHCFEDLCIAAVEEGHLMSIQAAQFVTDIDTLWGLIAAIDTHTIGRKHGSLTKKDQGFMIGVEVVDKTIFMKIMNSHRCDDWMIEATTAHMRKHGLLWCHAPAGQGNSEPQHIAKSFKRVIKYQFGNIAMVIEDDKQDPSRPHKDQENFHYTAFRQTEVMHENMQVFTHKAPALSVAPAYEKNIRVMSYLLFTQNTKAMIFEYSQDQADAQTVKFDHGIRCFSATATKRIRPNPNAATNGPTEMTVQDIWSDTRETKLILNLLNQLLVEIEGQAQAVAGSGTCRFLLRLTHKTDDKVKVLTEPAHLITRLISPAIVKQLRGADSSSSEDDGHSSEDDDDDSEDDGDDSEGRSDRSSSWDGWWFRYLEKEGKGGGKEGGKEGGEEGGEGDGEGDGDEEGDEECNE
ncbi:hypothetical protein ABKA04_003147 [Annulohypoxylon sp. FPYF3050]